MKTAPDYRALVIAAFIIGLIFGLGIGVLL